MTDDVDEIEKALSERREVIAKRQQINNEIS